jgi:hypothetical protein
MSEFHSYPSQLHANSEVPGPVSEQATTTNFEVVIISEEPGLIMVYITHAVELTWLNNVRIFLLLSLSESTFVPDHKNLDNRQNQWAYSLLFTCADRSKIMAFWDMRPSNQVDCLLRLKDNP